MKRLSLFLLILLVTVAGRSFAQTKLSVHWEELTSEIFGPVYSSRVVLVCCQSESWKSMGHICPLGPDLLDVRYAALRAAEQEYAVVFPEYYFAQIFEARHEPGTVAYSPQIQLALLQETTDEMARNGCKKVMIVNGHGGNESLLPYFAQTQLEKPHDYVVYVFGRLRLPRMVPRRKPRSICTPAKAKLLMSWFSSRPVHMDRAGK